MNTKKQRILILSIKDDYIKYDIKGKRYFSYKDIKY